MASRSPASGRIGAFALLVCGCSAFDAPRPAPPASRAVVVTVPRSPESRPPPPAPAAAELSKTALTALGQVVRAAREAVAPDEETLDADAPVLVATAKVTPIHARAAASSPRIGYLRAGAVVSRAAEPASREGCAGGFYEIEPEGFVCVGAVASIDPRHELARAASRRADRTAPLPYVYGRAPEGGAPLYARLPTAEEQRATEPDLDAHRARRREDSWQGLPLDEVPWFLEGNVPSLGTNGVRRSAASLAFGSVVARSGFAFSSLFESAGRKFGLTADMAVTPLDRFVYVAPSRFHGLPLGDGGGFPVVFATVRSVAIYSGDPRTVGLRFERRLERREAVAVTGRRARTGGAAYLETRDGKWLSDGGLLHVKEPASLPAWAAEGRRWVDVSLRQQVLVAYEGKTPVFVTLVSTGADLPEADRPLAESRVTPEGLFRIHTKHVTTTMDSDAVDDQFDLRDVPYVQYFKDGYAFHAAYWHDGFGAPRSHGCVNLSPLDARWLFSWTDPPVPGAWHGALSARGTLVRVRE